MLLSRAALAPRAALRRSASACTRHASTSTPPASSSPLVLGCGSNVVDIFFPVMALPHPGDKQYYAAETCSTDTVVGGVTLNHLAWARALGAPTGLMALQGADPHGEMIRGKLAELGVNTDFVRVDPAYSTSVSHIQLGPDGERTILMAPASTSRLTGDKMRAEFAGAVASRASMVTTEISQVPLSGVEALLDAAAARGVASVLDVDVTPSTATGPARLGTRAELARCVGKAGVLKLTASAAGELLALLQPAGGGAPLESALEYVAQQLADASGAALCVVTDGSRGSALALGRRGGSRGAAVVAPVLVPIYNLVTQRDATGAGDAFLGGLVASMHAWGLPTSAAQLERAGLVAAAAGAACVEVVGALPVPGVSPQRLAQLCPDAADLLAAARALDASRSSGAGAGATAPASPPALFAAFCASLAADAHAASEGAALYAGGGSRLQADVVSAVTALASTAATSGGGAPAAAVWVTGVGKSGAVAARLAISLRSVGLRASFVGGGDWAHGDLGAVAHGDVVVALSHSGRTGELLDAAPRLAARGARLLAITGDGGSPLARAALAHLPAPTGAGGELLGAVPTRSIVAQEAVANGLLSGVAAALGLTRERFRAHHPGGAIGATSPAGSS